MLSYLWENENHSLTWIEGDRKLRLEIAIQPRREKKGHVTLSSLGVVWSALVEGLESALLFSSIISGGVQSLFLYPMLTPHFPAFSLVAFMLILHVMCSLSNIWGFRKEIKVRYEGKPMTSASRLPPIETKVWACLSQMSFLSLLEMKWETWAGPELLFERVVALIEQKKPWWCQVRSFNCYQMYNYNHVQPPRPFWWAKKREINYLAK